MTAVSDQPSTEPARAAETEWPAVAAWMRLARVYHKIDRRSAEGFRAHGLTTAQFDVLAQVGARPGCSQQELADRLLVTKGNVAQLLAKMEARGLIERRQVARGRANLLFLTAEGEALRAAAVPAQEARIAAMFETLSPEELRRLANTLRTLDRSLV